MAGKKGHFKTRAVNGTVAATAFAISGEAAAGAGFRAGTARNRESGV